ncbi:MAG: hypothetical protein OXH92_15780 [Bryobacterales bacterium]|nr:hypothetical protein [Bryobacterales bacterium]
MKNRWPGLGLLYPETPESRRTVKAVLPGRAARLVLTDLSRTSPRRMVRNTG